MGMTFDDAVAAVTAAGSRFEMATAEVLGQELPVFKNTPPSMRSLFDIARGGEGIFLVYEDERWTFAEVMARVDALAATLVETYGVRPGDRVAISMRNYPEWIMSFAAAISVGAVAVCLNAWWTTDELAYGLDDSGAKVLLADVERIERVVPLLADGATTAEVIAVRCPDPLPDGVAHLDDVLLIGAAMPVVDIDLDDDATILYTSGTTGDPKGAVSSHRAVISALLAFGCRAAVTSLQTDDPDAEPPPPHPYPTCFILIVPLFHVTGCVPVMLSSFVTGCKLVMMRKWDPERALELIERERVTNFVGVPTMSWDLMESPDFDKRDTSSLLAVGGGGAPAPPELVRRIDKSFTSGRPNIGYGMTETNAYGPQNSGDDYLRKPTSSGRTVPVMQVRVVAEDGSELPTGGVGEIEFRGANLIRGYWNKPEATAEVFHDGWLRTGDLGRIDDEGFVYVEDRVKDMVLRGGENVFCAEIEAVLYEHGAVYEVAVFGIPHERLGEEVAAAIVVRDDTSVTADELQAHVATKLASFKVPTHVVFLDERLPRGATGKILKRDLRDQVVAAADPASS
jgi:long-chain acyl-CoA synthetase